MSDGNKVVFLRPGVQQQSLPQLPTREAIEQQRIIRDLSARYRKIRMSRPARERP
jgi:hypothetical protein